MATAIIIIALILIAVVLAMVNLINRIQEQERANRLQQRKWKIQADFLLEIVKCLEHSTPNPLIAKLINDEVIKLLKNIVALDKTPQPAHESSLQQAEIRAEELRLKQDTAVDYQRGSDEKIVETQLHLKEAITQVRHLCFQNIISEDDLSTFESELSWSYLMVAVTSIIARGQKLQAKGDKLGSRGLFERAQKQLTESLHPDPRRLEMLSELKELIDGSRDAMSHRLLPD